MNIPEKVHINGIPFDVHILDTMGAVLDNKLAACISYQDQQIVLEQRGGHMMQVSLLHEVIHGMLFALGRSDHDEVLVDGLAHQLHMFIRDNPKVFEFTTTDRNTDAHL